MAIKVLEYPDVLELIGITHSTNRIKHFYSLKNNLSKVCQAYFQNNIHLIENGLIYQGKFENYFRIFRSYILPIIHSKTTVNQLFETKTAEEQLDFYNKKWNTWLWKSLFKVFFSKLVLGKLGRDPQFFKENKLPVSQTIFNAAEGQIKVGLTTSQTSGLRPGRYVYDVVILDPSGSTSRVVEGMVLVREGVTHR
jgi:S-adenosylmethionine-diacylglycerol 3-amino-3-carboxypropyl transferase